MRRYALACCGLAFTFAHYGLAAAQQDVSAVVEKAIPAVVVVQTPRGLGTGFFVSQDGVVLTCYHVIEDAVSASIKTHQKATYAVEGYTAINPIRDVAVLRVEGKNLPTLPLGDSKNLKLGETVVAIGNPRGLEYTVSAGVVSAIRRVKDFPDELRLYFLNQGLKDDDELIQYTAPTSPGNSGGPLLNAKGEVVGIVILGYRRADNVYFAVPIDVAKPMLLAQQVTPLGKQLQAAAEFKKPYTDEKLGLGTTRDFSYEFKIPRQSDTSYRLPPGIKCEASTLQVVEKKSGRPFRRVDASPASGEYQVVRGRILVFSPQDSSKTLRITFRGTPQRVAILPAVNTTNLPYLDDAVIRNTEEQLRHYGFELVSAAEVREVCREQQFNPNLLVYNADSIQPVDIIRLAQALNVRYLILGVVSSDKITTGGTVYTGTSVVPVYYDGIFLSVGAVVVDGSSGKVVHAMYQHHTATVSTIWGGHRSAREKMVRKGIEQIFKEYYE
ncbi:MAG: hypothetical protein D6697_00765 [Armatimonadetes bacterium]|jgi:hypothetical protein|nr:MAG: hypothetical protein D6697_00765 [Armatimonadota bacterium]